MLQPHLAHPLLTQGSAHGKQVILKITKKEIFEENLKIPLKIDFKLFSRDKYLCWKHLVIVLSVDSAQCLVLSGKSLPFAISRGQLFTARKKVLPVRPK